MRVIAPFGFYGWGNIGDEATLQGFARLLARSPRQVSVWVGSGSPRHTARVEPSFRYFRADRNNWKRWWAGKRSSAVVVAGGTPIMDCLGKWPLCELTPLVEEAHARARPITFIGVGTERLVRDESRRIVSERLAPLVDGWTVRSSRDRERLIEYGIPPERVTVAADMAWLLDPVGPEWGARRLRAWGLAGHHRLLGVNLLGEKAVLARQPRLFEIVAQFLDSLVEQYGIFVLFLANEVRSDDTFDTAAAGKTKALMKHGGRAFIAPNDYLAPQQMMSLIANCHMTLSMRYHFCLFSALQGVPFVALRRSDKVVDLCGDLDWPFGSDLKDLRVDDLLASFESVQKDRASASERLSVQLPILRERACGNLAGLEALHEPKPMEGVTEYAGEVRVTS
jgi:polysaccharide pyruvyl transferase WcaK-like protein